MCVGLLLSIENNVNGFLKIIFSESQKKGNDVGFIQYN